MTARSQHNPSPDDHGADRPAGVAEVAAHDDGTRELVLVKQGRRIVYRCQPGGESELIAQIAAGADDPDCDLTWFDAAVLCHQLGGQFGRQIQQMKEAS